MECAEVRLRNKEFVRKACESEGKNDGDRKLRERIFWECVLRSSCLDLIEILDVVFCKDCAHGADQCEPVGMRVTVRTIILDPEDFIESFENRTLRREVQVGMVQDSINDYILDIA